MFRGRFVREWFQDATARAQASRSHYRQKLRIDSLEERCLLDGNWASLASMPTPRYTLNGAADSDRGIVYALGGQSGGCPDVTATEVYDAGADSWAPTTGMMSAHSSGGAAVVNGILYVIGGQSTCGGTVSSVEAYDPATNTWTPRAAMPEAAYGFGVAVVNDIIYVVDGSTGIGSTGRLAHTYAYDPASNTWTGKMPDPIMTQNGRSGVAAGAINGIIYVAGGSSAGLTPVPNVEAYDPATDSWTDMGAPMLTPRYLGAGAVVNNRLFVVGGAQSGYDPLPTLESYDPSCNRWTAEPPMLTARRSLAAASVNGVLYAFGGTSGEPNRLATNEAFTPTTFSAIPTVVSAITNQRFASVISSFTDSSCNPGAATEYSAIVDWGDGSEISTGGISDDGGGQFDVAASHTYGAAGEYQATVTITDNRDPTRTATAVTTIDVMDPGSPSPHGGRSISHGSDLAALAIASPARGTTLQLLSAAATTFGPIAGFVSEHHSSTAMSSVPVPQTEDAAWLAEVSHGDLGAVTGLLDGASSPLDSALLDVFHVNAA